MIIYFDLDDTLFDESAFCLSAYSEVAAHLSYEYGRDFSYLPWLMSDALRRRENPFDRVEAELRRLYPEKKSVDVRRLVEIYRNHCPESLPLPEASRRALDGLRRRGIILGLITDGRKLTQRNKLKALGLYQYFAPENILISEEAGGDKTSDVMFRKAMERHPGENMIYVGDNTSKDFRQPNLLGWTTFCLRHLRPMVHPQDFNTAAPDAPAYIITSLPELLLYIPKDISTPSS
ncbi:MAG: HAD family hydrolase [Bacteroidales bacterium]|nr:HAD family hydrolase [Bacteroidales bacterium]